MPSPLYKATFLIRVKTQRGTGPLQHIYSEHGQSIISKSKEVTRPSFCGGTNAPQGLLRSPLGVAHQSALRLSGIAEGDARELTKF